MNEDVKAWLTGTVACLGIIEGIRLVCIVGMWFF